MKEEPLILMKEIKHFNISMNFTRKGNRVTR